MPIRSLSSDSLSITFDFGQGPIELLYLNTQGQVGSNKHRDDLVDSINALMETRINIDDLPADEELINPRPSDEEMTVRFGERMFFERNGPNTFLVSTAVIASAVWDGTQYLFSFRRAV